MNAAERDRLRRLIDQKKRERLQRMEETRHIKRNKTKTAHEAERQWPLVDLCIAAAERKS